MRIIENRKWFYLLSLLVLIPGLISLCWPGRGLNQGIDFTGGSMLHITFEQSVQVKEVRDVLAEFGHKESTIQKSGQGEFFIRTHMLQQEESDNIIKAFNEKIGPVKIMRNEGVGPVIGKELTNKAILSVLVAAVLMLLYISFRFEFSFGVGAIAGTLHDVLLVMGIFSIFQLEVDSAFVAALLTVVGYSINDTIVIFDRIRENLGFKKRGDLAETVNKSIMQTLNRSINTVLTVLFALVALFIFGGETIRVFTLALLIGISVGCYSSIFLSSPIYYDLKTRGAGGKA